MRALPPPDRGLAALTDRALVATCINRDREPIDIQMRYFAPQYSAGEDPATGSAKRVPAGYWRKGLGDRLAAWQCSPDGGLPHRRCVADRCWIGGRVSLETPE